MKRLFLIIICLWQCVITFAQGVNFQDIAFQDALDKAKRKNKLIFMDCYVNRCGYCVKMDKEIFALKSVGEYMNKKFVCVRYNMDVGEGPGLNEKYEIGGYPHFVILTPKGEVVHKFLGYRQEKAFIEEMEKCYDKKHSYSAYQERYAAGERSVEFLNEYIQLLQKNRSRNVAGVLVDLADLLNDKEKMSERYWFLFSELMTVRWGSPNCNYLIKNYEGFCLSLGKEKVENAILRKFDGAISVIIYLKDTKEITEEEAVCRLRKMNQEITYLPTNLKTYAQLQVMITKHRLQQDFNGVIATCKRELCKLPEEKYIERIYSALCGKIISKVSPKQKQEWFELGEKLILKIENGSLKKNLEQIVNRNKL